MAKLWKKSGATLDSGVESYTAGTDYVFDIELMPFDITASIVHAKGLEKIGILTKNEFEKIASALEGLLKDAENGKIEITPADEDSHTVIENYLVKKLGGMGKKIHTGRSRNDQVLTAMRLYMKEKLEEIETQSVASAEAFLADAEKYQNVPLPGYSHIQQAMLSSLGHYFSSFTESLLDDAEFCALVEKHIDKSPLGSAAGFGVSIPLDRKFTTEKLGFAKTQVNSLYCQNSKGKIESAYMEALAQVMLTLGKFANDMLLFTSQEFDYFSADDSIVTGSSIMPHKRNLDILEIMRGNVSVVIANQLMIKDLGKNLISGYNRDTQLMKKPLIESTRIVLESLAVIQSVLKGLTPKQENIVAKIHPGMFAADIANDMVLKQGIPFRDAYKQANEKVRSTIPDLGVNIASKVSLGAPGNLDLKNLRERIKNARA